MTASRSRWARRHVARPAGLSGRSAWLAPIAGSALIAGCLSLAACNAPEGGLALPEVDPVAFELTVYPVLLADCGFPACHGGTERFFAVYGPGRQRLSKESLPYDPATPEELALSFTRARSMLVAEEGPARGPLLRKPLAIEAGGAGHGGDDPWGEPIYLTKRDPRWEALFYWATSGAVEEP